MTASSITVGLADSNVGDANRALGGNDFRDGEPRSFADALIKYFNNTGGIGGRKVVPVFARTNLAGGGDNATNEQTVCATYTEDNTIFAGMALEFSENTIACMRNVGTIAINSRSTVQYDDEIKRYSSHFYEPFTISLNRLFPAWVNHLASAGYFDKGARVGLISENTPAAIRAVEKNLKPALKAKGISLTEEARVTRPCCIDGVAQNQAETNNVVLRFQQAGITHVMIDNAFTVNNFYAQAERQGFRPRYGISSEVTARSVGGLPPSKQFERGVLVSFLNGDTGIEAGRTAPGAKRCLEALRAGGSPQPQGGTADSYAFDYCDFLFYLRAVLDRAPNFTPPGFLLSAEGLGADGFLATRGFRTNLRPGRHDGIDAVRIARYDSQCQCWKPATPLTSIG